MPGLGARAGPEHTLDNISGLFPHVNTTDPIFSAKLLIYNLTTLCLNGTLPCVDFLEVIMGDIPISVTHGCTIPRLPLISPIHLDPLPSPQHPFTEYHSNQLWNQDAFGSRRAIESPTTTSLSLFCWDLFPNCVMFSPSFPVQISSTRCALKGGISGYTLRCPLKFYGLARPWPSWTAPQ